MTTTPPVQVSHYPPSFEVRFANGWALGWTVQDGIRLGWKAYATGTHDYHCFASERAARRFILARPWR